MDILERLRGLLGFGRHGASASFSDPYALWLYFRCRKCGEVVRIRVDRRNDLNREDGPGTFLLRKEIMGSQCFQMIHADVWFDSNYSIVSSTVEGGEMISKDAYDAAQAL